MPQKTNTPTISGKEINDEIESINHKLAELELEKKALIEKREALLQQSSNPQVATTELSANQKVALFQKLFRGRSDIFANRWESSKGRSGYSVACDNEWVKGVCNKPKIKCSECSNRKYKILNDQIIYDHLSGKQIIGLYPLLTDNTCYLLAADFDKNDWQKSIVALAKACVGFNIPHAIEISRSGNGAHLWLFFSEIVLAKNARLLGFGLLDKAMEIHPDLSFDSYDRLFPNQDLMPDGGFGNLIALPLQYQARQRGNSLFVDINLKPYHDQWKFLSLHIPAQPEHITTRQYARILKAWLKDIGLDPYEYATHSIRRTKVSMIYRKTKNIRAIQLLLGHSNLESVNIP